MNKEDFWNLIDETNRLCPTRDKESIMAVATEKLMKLDVNDILDFHMIQQEYFRMAYRNDLHAASEAIGADPSFDGLQAFIYWLISRGKEVFINAMDNPDSLAGVPKEGEQIGFLNFGYAAYTAYSMKMDRINPGDMSDIYSALNSEDYGGLTPETREAIRDEIPQRADIAPSYSLNTIQCLFPNVYKENVDRLKNTGLYQEQVSKLILSRCIIHARVGIGLCPKEEYFAGTPENIANFLAWYKIADSMLLTDMTDRLVVYSSGWYIISCPDKSLLEKISETLFPLYRNEIEVQPVFRLSASEFEGIMGRLPDVHIACEGKMNMIQGNSSHCYDAVSGEYISYQGDPSFNELIADESEPVTLQMT